MSPTACTHHPGILIAYFDQWLVNGLMLGAVYALAAVAYTLVCGVVKMVNFAFGELFMLGASSR